MPSAPAKTKPKKDYDDIVVLSTAPDGETFTAKIFDDVAPFTFSTDVNFYLQMQAFSGEPGAINEFLLSIVEIEVDDDDDDKAIEQKRFETKKRFTDILKTTRHLNAERLVRFVLDISEIAGNGTSTSSSA